MHPLAYAVGNSSDSSFPFSSNRCLRTRTLFPLFFSMASLMDRQISFLIKILPVFGVVDFISVSCSTCIEGIVSFEEQTNRSNKYARFKNNNRVYLGESRSQRESRIERNVFPGTTETNEESSNTRIFLSEKRFFTRQTQKKKGIQESFAFVRFIQNTMCVIGTCSSIEPARVRI